MFCVIFILRVKAEKMFCKYGISTKKRISTNKRPENQFVQFWKDDFTCFELQWWRLTWHSHPHSVCSSTSTSAQILSHLLLWIVHCANKTWKRDKMHYCTKLPRLKHIVFISLSILDEIVTNPKNVWKKVVDVYDTILCHCS